MFNVGDRLRLKRFSTVLDAVVIEVLWPSKYYRLEDHLGMFLMPIEKVNAEWMLVTETAGCQHELKEYIGFTEAYRYCTVLNCTHKENF